MEQRTNKGIFSARVKGEGGTAVKVYLSGRELPDGKMEVQKLSSTLVPVGKERVVSRDEFTKRFEPEPEFFVQSLAGLDSEADSYLALAMTRGESAHQVNEDNILASFKHGLHLLRQGDKDKASQVFDRILELNAPFEAEHKHLFNTCGISLRKNGQSARALDFYRRAAKLVSDDENLYHNMARACFDKGDVASARVFLRKSLSINPELAVSKKFMRYLDRRDKRRKSIREPKYYRSSSDSPPTPFEE